MIKPETLIRWHRAAFRLYWRRLKSRSRGGRPRIDTGLRALMQQMSVENPLRRALGKLLKLGFAVAQSSVAKYMIKRRGPRDQGRRILLRNRAFKIAAMDLLVVPTIGFGLLHAFTVPCGAEWADNIVCRPILGGLHHQYGRM